MARGDRKKGREDRKPKQSGMKVDTKSAYQLRQNEAPAAPFKLKKK
jgi:hypothetical protein